MERLNKFLRLPASDRALLLQSTILLLAIRAGLATVRFATLRNGLSKLCSGVAARHPAVANGVDKERVIWAVEAIGRRMPSVGTCLTQALAAYVLLARRGHHSNLRIGVTRDRKGEFVAHAWLEKDGTVLIGGDWSDHYTPMPALNGLEP
jgi:hypothetical protein